MVAPSEHLYEGQDKANAGLILVTPARSRKFNGIIPGRIWCWLHSKWENIPDSWYEREKMLREEITEEWRHLQNAAGPTGASRPRWNSKPLTGWIGEYCKNRGWKAPNFEDRYEVFHFIHDLEEEKRAWWLKLARGEGNCES